MKPPIFATAAILLALAVSAVSVRAADATKPLKTVRHVDLARYMGDWRVIANVPYFAERGCIDSIEGYRARPDGKIDNYFTFRKGDFSQPQKRIHAVAQVYDHQTNAEWRVLFF